MTRIVLLGLAGGAGSGKTTAADYLETRYGFVAIALAAPIKEMLSAGLALSDAQLNGDEKEQPIEVFGGATPRRMFCALGDWGRALHEDLWINIADRYIDGLTSLARGRSCLSVVVSDVRLEREADWIRSRGGRMFHLFRPDLERSSEHVTERFLVRRCGDALIRNTGSTHDLFRRLDGAMPVGAE